VKLAAGDGSHPAAGHDLGMGRLACTIVVSGELDQRFDTAIEGLSLTTVDGMSELCGMLRDQAQLQGVLRQLFDLGLEVVSFTAAPLSDAVVDDTL
jgi:hypothetical protein